MLDKAIEWLSDNAPKIVEALQEPTSQSKIKELESLVGKTLPEDFIRLYQTHNGTNPELFANFAYGMPFISIEKSIRQTKGFDHPNDDNELKGKKGVKYHIE